jgi:hypothetical protein
MISSKGRPKSHEVFTIGENVPEVVNECKYFGLYLNKGGSFYKSKIAFAEQANKAMFALEIK